MKKHLSKVLGEIIFYCFASMIVMMMSSTVQASEDEALWTKVQKAGVLRAGAAVAPPYVNRDPKTGDYSGIHVDLVREFGEKFLGVKVEFVDTTWDNIIAGLQAGKWDISLALNRKPKRALAVVYTIAPVDYEITLVYNKKNPKIDKSWTRLDDFDQKGITLTTMSGTAADHVLTDLVKKAQIMRLPDVDSPRLALISKRADVLVDAGYTNLLFAKKYPDWATVFTPSPALAKQGIA